MDRKKPTVAVIGAGIAGLVTAKTLAQDGFDVCVLEKDGHLGGTWSPSNTYPGLRTNNTKQTYEFSDHAYPEDTDLSPRAEQVRAYLESYADRFAIREMIRFRQEVVSIDRPPSPDAAWTVKYRPAGGDGPESAASFDFIAVCNGVYHRPNIPEIPGAQSFRGRILHSSQVTSQSYGTGDQVVVVGGGKSAFDCATYAARQGMQPVLVYRRAQWMAPRFLPGDKIPGDWLVTSRLLAAFLIYHHTGTGQRILHTAGYPLVRLWWTLLRQGWRKSLQIPPAMVPDGKLPQGIEKIGVGGDFYGVLNEGKARSVRGTVARFTPGGVVLADGTELPATVVIFATGWHQTLAFLSEDLRRKIAGAGYIRLYRQIVPPSVSRIGFIGYAASVASQLTAEIGAHWLSEYFLGALRLPPADAMNRDIDRVHAWAEKHFPNRPTEGFIGPHLSHYIDDLMRDLRLPHKRAGGFFTEHFGLFRPSRYAGLSDERRQARS